MSLPKRIVLSQAAKTILSNPKLINCGISRKILENDYKTRLTQGIVEHKQINVKKNRIN